MIIRPVTDRPMSVAENPPAEPAAFKPLHDIAGDAPRTISGAW